MTWQETREQARCHPHLLRSPARSGTLGVGGGFSSGRAPRAQEATGKALGLNFRGKRGDTQAWLRIPARPLTSGVSLGVSYNASEPQSLLLTAEIA